MQHARVGNQFVVTLVSPVSPRPLFMPCPLGREARFRVRLVLLSVSPLSRLRCPFRLHPRRWLPDGRTRGRSHCPPRFLDLAARAPEFPLGWPALGDVLHRNWRLPCLAEHGAGPAVGLRRAQVPPPWCSRLQLGGRRAARSVARVPRPRSPGQARRESSALTRPRSSGCAVQSTNLVLSR